MMSEETKRDRALVLREAAESHIQAGNYREVDEKINELFELTQGDPDFVNLEVSANELKNRLSVLVADTIGSARDNLTAMLGDDLTYRPPVGVEIEKTEDYLKQAEEMARDMIGIWEAQARSLLANWERALIDEAHRGEYNRYTQLVTTRLSTLRNMLRMQAVKDLCERLWARAEALMRDGSNVNIATIITNYYERALTIVNKALAEDPDNIELQALQQRAKDTRELHAIGAQVLTSAVEAEAYTISLKQLEGLPNEQLVPGFQFMPDTSGKLEARQVDYISVAEARRRLLDMAGQWAHSKALEYLNLAENALRDHNPELAQIELANRSKINEFLDSTDKNEFEKLHDQIDEALAQLHEAQRLAEQAQKILPDGWLEAWQLYTSAVEKYPWAGALEPTRSAIVAQMSIVLDSRLQDANTAFTTRDFNRLRSIVSQTRDQFTRVNEPGLVPRLEELNALDERAKIYNSRLRAAQARLRDIERGAAQNPSDTLIQLDDLEQEYGDVLDGIKEQFSHLQADARLRGDAAAEQDRLRGFITNRNLIESRQALADARRAAGRFQNDATFQHIAEQLQLHVLFLEAQRDEANGLYQDALKKYKEVFAVRDHVDAGQASNRYQEVQELIAVSADIAERLQSAEQLIRTDPVEAYQQLQALTINNPEQRADRDRLMITARNQAQMTINERMRRYARAPETQVLPVSEIRWDIEMLGRLGLSDDQARWEHELGAQMAYQDARAFTNDALAANSAELLERAIDQWKQVEELAKSTGKTRISRDAADALSRARKQHLQMSVDALIRSVRQENSDNPDIKAQITRVEAEIANMQRYFTGDPEIELWRSRMALAIANNSYRPKERSDYFTRAVTIARSTLEMSANDTILREARQIVERASAGGAIALVMEEISQAYDEKQRTVQKLLMARGHWKEEIAPYIAQDTTGQTEPIVRWWQQLNANLIATIDEQIGTTSVETAHFNLLAMLLVVDPDNVTAREVIAKIDTYESRLRGEVEKTIASVTTGEGFTGSSGLQILDNQRGYAQALDEDLSAIRELAALYQREDPDVASSMSTIANDVGNLKLMLNAALAELDQFRQNINKVIERLAIEQQTGNFSESLRLINTIRQKFLSHPASRYIDDERSRRIKRREELTQALKDIAELINQEDYDTANQQMSRVDVAELDSFDLSDGFEIADPKNKSLLVRPWQAVYEMVQARSKAGAIPVVVAFAELFDDYSAGRGAITGAEPPPARRAVDWEQARQTVQQHIAKGEFESARMALRLAVEGDPTNHNMIALTEVNKQIIDPPIIGQATGEERAEAERDPAKRYPLAQRYANSQRGESILQRLERERVPYYRAAGEEAKALNSQIDAARREWDNGWREWETAIGDIAQEFPQGVPGRSRRGSKPRLQGAVERAIRAYRRCYDACSQRAALKEMLDLYLYQYAVKMSGVNPERIV